MYDLASVHLTLMPTKTNILPPWLGRAAHAQFLAAMRAVNPALATAVHDSSRPKPFTSSSLIGGEVTPDGMKITPGQSLSLRYTTLHSDLTTILLNGLLPMWRDEGVTIHDQPFKVHTARMDTQWSGCTTYDALLYSASETQKTLTLHFGSPTMFKGTAGHFLTLPTPAYVFGSLMRRWNSFAPQEFPTAMLDVIDEYLVAGAYDIRTEEIHFKRRRQSSLGFRGQISYRILSDDTTLIRYLNTLADFALYSGVGGETGVGMGQVRRVET